MGTKKCKACLEKKPISEFGKDKSKKDGLYLYHICTDCKREGRRVDERYYYTGETYKCLVCGEIKDLYLFDKRKDRSYTHEKRCRSCAKKRITIMDTAYDNSGNKRCSICLEYKPTSEFHSDKDHYDDLYSQCKICANKEKKKYRDSLDPEIKRQKKREEYLRHRDDYIRRSSIWSKENSKRRNEWIREYSKEKLKNDPLYRIKRNIRALIKESFIRADTIKSSKSTQILGCSMKEFKDHIESQFEKWMAWDNWGLYNGDGYNKSWQLDHIIPMSIANTEEEVYKLNHYTNFQPLCSLKNIEKGNCIEGVSNIEINLSYKNNKLFYN